MAVPIRPMTAPIILFFLFVEPLPLVRAVVKFAPVGTDASALGAVVVGDSTSLCQQQAHVAYHTFHVHYLLKIVASKTITLVLPQVGSCHFSSGSTFSWDEIKFKEISLAIAIAIFYGEAGLPQI